jgi:hypothetical protein
MSKESTYTVAIDSRNRDTQIYPDPADCVIDINLSRGIPISRMYLGSIELPLPQYIIEDAWNRLHVSEGLALIVNSEDELPLRTFTIMEYDGNMFDVIVPIWLNPVVDVDQSDPLNPIFTTMFPHALALRGEWTWEPIRLIGSSITNTSLLELTEDNPSLTILSSTEFQLAIPAPQNWVPENFGYVHAPAIPNPEFLAQIVTAGLNILRPARYVLRYDRKTNQFCLRITSIPCAVQNMEGECNTNFSVAKIIAAGENSLGFIMGFGCTNLPLPPGDDAVKKGVCGMFCYQCLSFFEFTIGNYTAETFLNEFNLQANRFYFECGCNNDTSCTSLMPPPSTVTPDVFKFSNACGVCLCVPIPCGKYSPVTLAMYLETQMNTLDPTGNYTVTWNGEDGRFVFSSTDVFGLEFDDPQETVGMRLGFSRSCFRGSRMYISTDRIHVPLKGCNCTTIPKRMLSNIYVPILRRSQKRFGINACKDRTWTGTFVSRSDGLVTITSDTSPVTAHGFQAEDVITLREMGDPNMTYDVVVAEIVDAFTFRFEASSTPYAAGSISVGRVCVNLFGPVIFNLFLLSSECADPVRRTTSFPTNTFRNEVLGFPAEAILWQNPLSLPFIAPFVFNLDPPDYLIVEIVKPTESRYIQHRWKNDTITTVFAKLAIYPGYRLDRVYPMEVTYQGLQIINQVHFRILTPDHNLYNFHGRNWSMTLVLQAVVQTGAQLCY